MSRPTAPCPACSPLCRPPRRLEAPRRTPRTARLLTYRSSTRTGRRTGTSWAASGCSAWTRRTRAALRASIKQADRDGWNPTKVPNAWNAQDVSDGVDARVRRLVPQGLPPAVAQSRHELDPAVRVGQLPLARVDERPADRREHRRVPPVRDPHPVVSSLKRTGTNRLVVRVDSIRKTYDLPPSGLSTNNRCRPAAGGTTADPARGLPAQGRPGRLQHRQVLSRAAVPTCDASVHLRVTVRNAASTPQRVRVSGRFGGREVRLGTASVGPGDFATLSRRIPVGKPAAVVARAPTLYGVRFEARAGDRQVVSRYTAQERHPLGRSSSDGHLLLNGLPVNIRGVGLHEDDKQVGFAVDNAMREQYIAEVKEVGATAIRAALPAASVLPRARRPRRDPPVVGDPDVRGEDRTSSRASSSASSPRTSWRRTSTPTGTTRRSSCGRWATSCPRGRARCRATTSARGQAQARRSTRRARSASPSPATPVGCQPEYAPLDIIGINEYFGWYPGPNGRIADRTRCPTTWTACAPATPARRSWSPSSARRPTATGPVEEKGTYELQQDFVNYHLGVYATKPWLSGAFYWALKEFRVRPAWEGGNPRPQPPIHQKGLISFDGARKPAYGRPAAALRRRPRSVPPQPALASALPSNRYGDQSEHTTQR